MPVRVDILPARYRDAELIGRGGMGEIYRALDEVLGRDVAVKLLAERFAHEDEVRERFTREALTAARLSGEPNVVTIFDVGEHRGRPFIVMEHLGGGSLEDVLRREGAQPPGRALDLARGRRPRARRGPRGRDRPPRRQAGEPAARRRRSTSTSPTSGSRARPGLDSFTRPGTVLGTAGYLSPEQAGGERATSASDRYALGVVAFELLSGERPFERDNPTAEAAAHVRAPIPAISAREPGAPARARPRVRAGAGQGSRGPLRERRRARRGAPGRLRRGRRDDPRRGPGAAPGRADAHGRAAAAAAALGPAGIVLTVLALAVLGGLVAYALTRDDDEPQTQQPQGRTVVRTLVTTAPGTTQRVTVTTQAEEEPPPEDEPPPQQGANGVALTDQSTGLLNEGRYEEALPVAQQALAALQGSGELYEAYANYNVGKALLGLGRCAEAIPYFDRSEQIQGERSEITRDRAAAEQCA